MLSGNNGDDLLKGDNGNDFLHGTDGNDVIDGGYGNDFLSGGAGKDKFIFHSLSEGIDRITDFTSVLSFPASDSNPPSDKVLIDQVGFGASGTDQFIYDYTTRALFFDASPSDSVAPAQFASIGFNAAGFVPSDDILLV